METDRENSAAAPVWRDLRQLLWVLLVVVVVVGIAVVVFAHPWSSSGSGEMILRVNTLADLNVPCKKGAYSLRCAIIKANLRGSDTRIIFTRAGTLVPRTPLPGLRATNSVIDASTAPGAHVNTLGNQSNAVLTVHIDGRQVPNARSGILIEGSHDTVRGLDITGFNHTKAVPAAGIWLYGAQSHDNVIAGNFLGVLPDGHTAVPNHEGIASTNGAGHNTFGGPKPADWNVASGNAANGIYLLNSKGNKVFGNLLGTDPSGTKAVPNFFTGFRSIGDIGDKIGGAATGEGNLVSGSAHIGINLQHGSKNVVAGNFVGTDYTGRLALPNGTVGIWLFAETGDRVGGRTKGANLVSGNKSSGIRLEQCQQSTVVGNSIGTNAPVTAALPNLASGVFLVKDVGSAVTGNRVAGNNNGISIDHGKHETIQSNRIGLDASGTHAVVNRRDGISMTASKHVLIGGTGKGDGNVIAGSALFGIESLNGLGLRVQGNTIGLNAAGNAAIPNKAGIAISGDTDAIVGTGTPAGRNVLSGNATVGIEVVTADRVEVRDNLIGTDATGTHAVPNQDGVLLHLGVVSLTAQGLALTHGAGVQLLSNVISGNRHEGVIGDGFGEATIDGNHIGTTAAGLPLGNGLSGVYLANRPSPKYAQLPLAFWLDNNIIANNGCAGVLVSKDPLGPTKVTLAGNRFLKNKTVSETKGPTGPGACANE